MFIQFREKLLLFLGVRPELKHRQQHVLDSNTPVSPGEAQVAVVWAQDLSAGLVPVPFSPRCNAPLLVPIAGRGPRLLPALGAVGMKGSVWKRNV